MAFDRAEISDEARLLAHLCAIVFNAHREEGAKALDAADFLPRLKKHKPRRDPRNVARNLMFWAKGMQARKK